MKKESTVWQTVKLLLLFLAGCFLWLIVFSTFMPADETGATTEPFPGAICVCGVLTAIIFVSVSNYNSMQRAFQKTKSSYSNIQIFKDRTERLLEKANRVADKYMAHEENVQVGVAEMRTPKSKFIRNAEQFQVELERYPDLKANDSVMELLAQIRESENAYAQSKINYNVLTEQYNTLIHVFPNSILRKLFKFEDVEFYNEEPSEITDEELGI